MTSERPTRRDITDLFNEGSGQGPTAASDLEAHVSGDDGFVSLPFADPVGLLEQWSEGRVRDPVRLAVIMLLEEAQSYFDPLGHQP